MDSRDIRNLQEAYIEIYSNITESAVGDRAKRAVENQRGGFYGDDHAINQARKNLSISMDKLRSHQPYVSRASADRAAKQAEKNVRSGKTKFEQVDIYDLVLTHLLDEGYANDLESAENIMVSMSEEWRESIVEGFVDPEEGEAPSGRSPLENVSYHPKKSVRRKAMGAFAHQMGKEYGGKWKSRTKDPTKD